MAKKKVGRRGRGGRKPGKWTLLTDASFRAFRKEAGLSRSRLSELLGVSSTSIQNWETGRSVPLTRYQHQIVELMKGGAPRSAPPARNRLRPARMNGSAVVSHDTCLTVTGEILREYLATPKGGQLTQDELIALAVSLRAAFS